ncbi:ABC transporter ATP-binding protein uup [Clostridiaceae bacterium JG1575]|nr:ABC transporter ATP-binding protein uup [Clostridiaceae bacterium JG1575]
MITVNNVSLRYGGRKLFEDVHLKFTPGNCYGVIGANGAGKSTFLKILSGELEPNTGEVSLGPHVRLSVLRQDHHAFDEEEVLKTVIRGNQPLFDIMEEKDALYAKEDFSDEDGMRAATLEAEFAEMNGWEAEAEAGSLLQGLGIPVRLHEKKLKELEDDEKVKVLLAQALFGQPGVLILDEPTNNLDVAAITWLENFLAEFPGTVIVVSHDRHFLNMVCTHVCDVDYGKIKVYMGNYDFWYESSQLTQQLLKDQNKKREEKIRDLEAFIARFSANASKSRQATSRKKLLDKISLNDIAVSSRRYPFVGFKPEREPGNDVLFIENLSKTVDGVKVLDGLNLTVLRGDKIAFAGSDVAITTLFRILAGELEPDEGSFRYGVTITSAYFPKDNSAYFQDSPLNLVDWMRQYSQDQTETYVRGFLGRMLFSGEEALKEARVLSGGERVRCMLSRMMLSSANLLILDQPTNHLDLESITALNDGMMAFKGVLLFACHDHQFVQTVANRIVELKGDGITDFRGTYDEFLETKGLGEMRA